jgi:hypothetical protein
MFLFTIEKLQFKQQATAFSDTDLVPQSKGSSFQSDLSTMDTTERVLVRLTFNITRNAISVGDLIKCKLNNEVQNTVNS